MTLLALALAGAALALTSCGGEDAESQASSGERPSLVVSAASSMSAALEACAPAFERATVRLQFAGSDELAAQIRRGVKPDVYAAANTALPEELREEGLLSKPVGVATNELVLAVPKGSSRVSSLADLTRSGVKLAVGAASVPVGSYTRELLRRLPARQGRAVLANVRSNEPDVAGVVGKLTQGAADAGFVYLTDVVATGGRVRAIQLPKGLRPSVVYGAAVVRGTARPREARAFIEGLLRGRGRAALQSAGFEPAPR